MTRKNNLIWTIDKQEIDVTSIGEALGELRKLHPDHTGRVSTWVDLSYDDSGQFLVRCKCGCDRWMSAAISEGTETRKSQ